MACGVSEAAPRGRRRAPHRIQRPHALLGIRHEGRRAVYKLQGASGDRDAHAGAARGRNHAPGRHRPSAADSAAKTPSPGVFLASSGRRGRGLLQLRTTLNGSPPLILNLFFFITGADPTAWKWTFTATPIISGATLPIRRLQTDTCPCPAHKHHARPVPPRFRPPQTSNTISNRSKMTSRPIADMLADHASMQSILGDRLMHTKVRPR